jgi:hypothetical protein
LFLILFVLVTVFVERKGVEKVLVVYPTVHLLANFIYSYQRKGIEIDEVLVMSEKSMEGRLILSCGAD